MIRAPSPELLETLRQHQILNPEQLEEIGKMPPATLADAQSLARELLRRDWLIPWQANRILKGQAAELVLGPYVFATRKVRMPAWFAWKT